MSIPFLWQKKKISLSWFLFSKLVNTNIINLRLLCLLLCFSKGEAINLSNRNRGPQDKQFNFQNILKVILKLSQGCRWFHRNEYCSYHKWTHSFLQHPAQTPSHSSALAQQSERAYRKLKFCFRISESFCFIRQPQGYKLRVIIICWCPFSRKKSPDPL